MGSVSLSYYIPTTVIPPHIDGYEVVAECASECTQMYLWQQNVTMVYWFPHMHTIGDKVIIKIIRKTIILV